MAREGHGAPGMGTEPPRWAQIPVRTHSLRRCLDGPASPRHCCGPRTSRSPGDLELFPTNSLAWVTFRSIWASGARGGTGVSRGMNPWFVLTVTEPMFPASPCKGKPWKSPGKAAPEAPTQLQTWNAPSADGRTRPGRKAEPRRDLLEQIHQGKPPGTPGDRDVPAGTTPRGHTDPGTQEG